MQCFFLGSENLNDLRVVRNPPNNATVGSVRSMHFK